MKRAFKFHFILFGLILFLFFYLSCGEDTNRMVARVGGKKITTEQFITSFARGKKTAQVRNASIEEKKKHLDILIKKALQVIDAYQMGLDKDSLIQARVEDRAKNFMFRRLVNKNVIDKLIPESKIKDYYRKASKEVKIRQIVVKYDAEVDGSKKRAHDRALEILKKLKTGDKFDVVARKRSEDEETKSKGGILGYLKWGPNAYKNPIYLAAFEMKEDEISEPIEYNNAFYIIKVVHIKRYPAPPYEQQKEQIRQTIFRVYNKEIQQAFDEYLIQLKNKYRLQLEDEGAKIFLSKINKVPTIDSLKKKEPKLIDRFSPADLNVIIARLSFANISIKDVVTRLELYPRHRRPRFRTLDDVKIFVEDRVVNEYILNKEMDASGIEKDPIVKRQVKDYLEEQLIQRAYAERVTKKINLKEEDFKKYFEEHREEFKNPPMREVQEIYVKSKETADKIVKLARAGRSFTALFNQYNEKETLKKNKGKIGYISRGRAGIGKPAFNVEVGGVTDPIRIGNGYSIIKVLSEKPETLKTYEEAQRLVQARVRRLERERLEKEWLESLRKKIDVVIYDKALEEAGKNYIGSDFQLAN